MTTVQVVGPNDYCFMVPLEKFVYKTNGAWDVSAAVGKTGILHHLVAGGWDPALAKMTLDNMSYNKVYGFECEPGSPDHFQGPDGKTYINSWQPPKLTPAAGDWPTLARVLDWLTGNDPAGRRWLEHWLAVKIQRPAYVPKVAVVFTTEQAGGKGTLFVALREILGAGNVAILGKGEISNRFNGRWAGKLLVMADEIMSGGDMGGLADKLKVLIDGSTIEMERKGRDQLAVRNRLAWIFASNDRIDPVQLEGSDRRYTVFSNHDTPPDDYKPALKALYRLGDDSNAPTEAFLREIAGFAHYLQNLTVDGLLISEPYANESRRQLLDASAPSHDLFFSEVDRLGIDPILDEVLKGSAYYLNASRKNWDRGVDGVGLAVIYQCYVEFTKRTGGRPLRQNRFEAVMRKSRRAWGSKVVDGMALYAVPRGARQMSML